MRRPLMLFGLLSCALAVAGPVVARDPPCDLSQSGEVPYCESCKDYVDGDGRIDKKTGACAKCGAAPAMRKICDKGGWHCEKCGAWSTKKGKCKQGHDEVDRIPKVVRCKFDYRCPGCGAECDGLKPCGGRLCSSPNARPVKACQNSTLAPHAKGYPRGSDVQKEIDRLAGAKAADPKVAGAPSFAEEKKKVVDALVRDLTARAEGFGKKNDHEAAMVLYALAEAAGADGANPKVGEHSEKIRKLKKLERLPTDDLGAAGRDWKSRMLDLQASAVQKRQVADALWCEVAGQQLSFAGDFVAALRAINDRRLAAGLKPVGVRQDVSRSCMLHVRYLSFTKRFDIGEDPASPYATPEGTDAAKAGVVAEGALPAAVERWMRTVRGRTEILSAGLKNVGFGQWVGNQADACMVDCKTGRTPATEIVTWPPDGAAGVETEYAGETPSPLPAGAKSCGNPVTVTFPDARPVSGAACALEEVVGGKKLDCHVSDPARPAFPGFSDNLRTIVAIPKEPLKAKTKYRATVTAVVDGKPFNYTFDFETK